MTIDDAASQLEASQEFLRWFQSNGGWYHPHLEFSRFETTGLGLGATITIPADSTILRMPRRLALTAQVCRKKLLDALGQADNLAFDKPADWAVFYLFLVRLLEADTHINEEANAGPSSSKKQRIERAESPNSGLLSHTPYVQTLPRTILTPPGYTEAERELLRGTPLHGDAIERRKQCGQAFGNAVAWLKSRVEGTASDDSLKRRIAVVLIGIRPSEWKSLDEAPFNEVTSKLFEIWVWAQAAFSSRAFPPKMASPPDHDRSLSSPILLPGMDAFNHARGVPVTWAYPCAPDQTEPAKPAVSLPQEDSVDFETSELALTLHYSVDQGQQAFNSYGGKSNEEFLAGYGFVLPDGLDDTLTLVLGDSSSSTAHQNNSDGTQMTTELESTEGDASSAAPTALSIRKPWGAKHYWRRRSAATKEAGGAPVGLLMELRERLLKADDDVFSRPPALSASWLLKPYTASASPSVVPTPAAQEADGRPASALEVQRRLQVRLKALKLDGEILETLEEMLCAKRKSFKQAEAAQQSAASTDDPTIRPEVRRMVAIYREGQRDILNQAIEWTREKMDQIVDLIEECEDEGEQDDEDS